MTEGEEKVLKIAERLPPKAQEISYIEYLKEAMVDRPSRRGLETYQGFLRDGLNQTGALRIDKLHTHFPDGSIERFLESRRVDGETPPTWVDLGCGQGVALQEYPGTGKTLLLGVDYLEYPEFDPPDYNGETFGLYKLRRDLNHETQLPPADFITAIGVEPYLTDPSWIIASAYQALKEGGFMFMSVPTSAHVKCKKGAGMNLINYLARYTYDYKVDEQLLRTFLGGTLGDGTTFFILEKRKEKDIVSIMKGLKITDSFKNGDQYVTRYEEV